ncbi:MAG TPA: FtsX-like permease family protein [Symbiobacteriaceae bacterium]|nr:FtsX-like permease family protein [Symbiobacteriaceae bacterium]
MRTLLQMAFRNVFRQRRRSLLLGLSVAFGVVVLLLGLAFVEAFQQQLFQNLLVQQAGNFVLHNRAHVVDLSPLVRPNNDFSKALTADEFGSELTAIPGIREVREQIQFTGSLVHADGTTQVNAIGMASLQGEPLAELIGATRTSGSGQGLFLPQSMSEETGVKPGDQVTLYTRAANGQMAQLSLTVQGLFEARAPWLTNRVYLPLGQAQQVLGLGDQSMEWLVYLAPGAKPDQVQAALGALTAKDPALQVSTVNEIGGFYAGAILGFKALMIVNVGILFIVVAMGLTNMMLMATLERTQEIGTLLAVGTPRWRVALLVVLEAMLLGLMAIGAGGLIAYGGGAWFAVHGIDLHVDALSYTVGGTKIFLAFTGSHFGVALAVVLGTIVLATLYPAVKASSWSPIRALRGLV